MFIRREVDMKLFNIVKRATKSLWQTHHCIYEKIKLRDQLKEIVTNHHWCEDKGLRITITRLGLGRRGRREEDEEREEAMEISA